MTTCMGVARSTGRPCRRKAGPSGLCALHAPSSIEAVAETGDRRRTLEALRQVIAQAVDDDPSPRDLAALTRRLQLLMGEIAALPEPKREESVLDEIARRRAAREATA